jgi:hypothetical protein
MSKLVTGLLILRNGNNSDWTAELDNQMKNWTKEYINWLQTSPIALGEYDAEKYWPFFRVLNGKLIAVRDDSNHGTYYYNQLAALQILVGNTSGASTTLKTYFTKQYLEQINANGEQVSDLINVFYSAHFFTALGSQSYAPLPLPNVQHRSHDRKR